MRSEKPELEGNPDPAGEIEPSNECNVVEMQASGFQKRSIGHTSLLQPPKMSDLGSTDGRRQYAMRSSYVLHSTPGTGSYG